MNQSKTYTFRMNPELHKRVRIAAAEQGVPMKIVVLDAIEAELQRRGKGRKVHGA